MSRDDALTRVLAITSNHSLVIGLTFLDRNWDVTSRSAAEGSLEADVLVVDLGPTRTAIEALAPYTDRPPAVVVGIEPLEVAAGDRFLPRPFTLDDLADSVELVRQMATATAASAATTDSTASAEQAEQAEQVASGPAEQAASGPAEPAALSPWVGNRPSGHAGQHGEGAAARGDAPVRSRSAGYWVIPGWALDRHRPPEKPEDGKARAPDGMDDSDEDVIDLRAFDVESGTMAPQPVSEQVASDAESGGEAPRSGLRRLRSLATRGRDSAAAEPVMRRDEALQRFARGVSAGGEIEKLLAELPVLRSVGSLARGIVEEVHRELGADTTALWQRYDDGFWVLASQGLTPNQQRRVASIDQPMLGEVDATGGGLLIDPVEAAQAAVAGIGGAHTESFMAASIAVGTARHGVIAVGRNRPLRPADLDRLIGIATEAAPGMAVAQLLQRLGGQIVLATGGPTEVIEDERTREQGRFTRARN